MKNKKQKKFFITALIAVVVIVLPILIASFILRQNLDADLEKGSVTSVTLIHDEEQDEVTAERDISFFISVAKSGESIAEAADPLEIYRKCRVVFHKPKNDREYVFYLSDSVNNCVYTDPDGALFLIPQETAEELLTHPMIGGFAVSYAAYPELCMTQGGKTFSADHVKGEWTYAKANDTTSAKIVDAKNDSTVILPQGERPEITFPIKPDFCSVILKTESDELLFTGAPEEIPTPNLSCDTALVMTVSCDWFEESHPEYHGKLEYSFQIFYDVPALCTVDRITASPGETFVVTVTNSSSESHAFTPTFAAGKTEVAKEGTVITASIPILENATPGEYTIKVLGSDVEKELTVTIVPPTE